MLNSYACAGVTRCNKSVENGRNCYRQLLAIFLSLSSHFFLKIPLAACLLMITKMLTGEGWRISKGKNFEVQIFLKITSVFCARGNNCVSEISSRATEKLWKLNCIRNCKETVSEKMCSATLRISEKKVKFGSNQPSLSTSGFLFAWFDSDHSWSFFWYSTLLNLLTIYCYFFFFFITVFFHWAQLHLLNPRLIR